MIGHLLLRYFRTNSMFDVITEPVYTMTLCAQVEEYMEHPIRCQADRAQNGSCKQQTANSRRKQQTADSKQRTASVNSRQQGTQAALQSQLLPFRLLAVRCLLSTVCFLLFQVIFDSLLNRVVASKSQYMPAISADSHLRRSANTARLISSPAEGDRPSF